MVDVRTRAELEAAFVPGSLHLDYKDSGFEAAIAALDGNRTYLVFCASGVRSARAAAVMKEKGLTARTLQGGLGAGGVNTVAALPLPQALTQHTSTDPADSLRSIFSLSNGDIVAEVECLRWASRCCSQYKVEFANKALGHDSVFVNPVEAQNYVFTQFRSLPFSQ